MKRPAGPAANEGTVWVRDKRQSTTVTDCANGNGGGHISSLRGNDSRGVSLLSTTAHPLQIV